LLGHKHVFKNTDRKLKYRYKINQLPGENYKTYWYGGNKVPEKDGNIKEFSELAEPEDAGKNEETFSKLAFLRMDVDHLGNFIKETDNPTELARTSLALDYFFHIKLKEIWKTGKTGASFLSNDNNETPVYYFKDSILIVYSGGDDLFILGKWDAVLEFAKEVHDKFTEYRNSVDLLMDKSITLTISGGMVINDPKFPVAKAAQMAGEMEDRAKYNGRDSFCLFGMPIKWGNEMDFVKEQTNWLFENVYINKFFNRSVLFKLQGFKAIKDKGDPDWLWLSTYQCAKMLKQTRASKQDSDEIKEKKKNARNAIENLREIILGKSGNIDKEKVLNLIYIAARLVEYKTRELLKTELNNNDDDRNK